MKIQSLCLTFGFAAALAVSSDALSNCRDLRGLVDYVMLLTGYKRSETRRSASVSERG